MKTLLKEEWVILMLILVQAVLILALVYEMGKDSVSTELHNAIDNNLTIREFYFKTYPKSYKKYYTDWKQWCKQVNYPVIGLKSSNQGSQAQI